MSGNIISQSLSKRLTFDEWLKISFNIFGNVPKDWRTFARIVWAEAFVAGENYARSKYEDQIDQISNANGALRVIIKNSKQALEALKRLG